MVTLVAKTLDLYKEKSANGMLLAVFKLAFGGAGGI